MQTYMYRIAMQAVGIAQRFSLTGGDNYGTCGGGGAGFGSRVMLKKGSQKFQWDGRWLLPNTERTHTHAKQSKRPDRQDRQQQTDSRLRLADSRERSPRAPNWFKIYYWIIGSDLDLTPFF